MAIGDRAGSIPARQFDILETVGAVLTRDNLLAEYEARFGPLGNTASFRRAFSRLAHRPDVESVTLERADSNGTTVRGYRVRL